MTIRAADPRLHRVQSLDTLLFPLRARAVVIGCGRCAGSLGLRIEPLVNVRARELHQTDRPTPGRILRQAGGRGVRVGVDSEVVRAPVCGLLEGDEELGDEDPDRATVEGVKRRR